ncbi:MAG: DUF2059 domain-containing protein [Pseudomonadota bacterium]
MKMGLKLISTLRALVIVSTTFGFSLSASYAQEVTAEHTAAAKAAMVATGATTRLDKILPELSAFTKAGLITNRPDIEAEISTIVDDVAISLAARRGPLENEVAAIYTKLFTLEELQTIETFFASETGEKFLTITPRLFGEIDQVAKVWRAGITRDMSEQVQKKLTEAGLQ